MHSRLPSLRYRQEAAGGDTEIEDGLVKGTLSEYINSRVSYIRNYAFTSFISLKHVSLQKCRTIYPGAFFACKNLESYSFPICTAIREKAFTGCTHLGTADFSKCDEIGTNAFSGCTSLSTVSLPECTHIHTCAFSGCTSLSRIYLPLCELYSLYEGKEVYGQFSGCTGLLYAEFPTTIRVTSSCFVKCSSLRAVSFPNCRYINAAAFMSCTSLVSVYLLGSSVPTLSSINVFSYTPIINSSYTGSFGSIIVMESMLEAFKTANIWSNFSERFSVYNGTD